MKTLYHAMALAMAAIPITASPQVKGLTVDVEAQASISNSTTPLWLNANKYGLSSLYGKNGYVRGTGTYELPLGKKAKLEAGVDLVVPIGYKSGAGDNVSTEHFILQQAYVKADYKLGELIIGAKQMPMELKNNELSSGSQTLGINARPVPQIRIGLNDYWNIPGLKHWLGIKAHMAYGIMTDGGWEEEFAKGTGNHYNTGVLYHQKAGYLRVGNEEKFPLTLTLGLEMASQFGGKYHDADGSVVSRPAGFKSFCNAFIGSGSDYDETLYKNAEGNTLGSWVMRLNWKAENWEVGAYADHFFEDHSGMFFLDYDGYGSGAQWNEKVTRRYFRYDLKDCMLGVDMRLKKFRYVNQAVAEFVNTRYQSGPIYHDHTVNRSTHVCGRDGYYTHNNLPGWQHWGQVMGNPLYLSPAYNTDGNISTQCNRFKAWHFGLAGDPIDGLHYRVKLSWQRGYGTYDAPYVDPRENLSMLFEAAYQFRQTSIFKGFTVTGAYGFDHGELRGNNSGAQLTVKYHIM